MKLRYGMNPNQDFAELVDRSNALELLNGQPSYINILDALNSWQLVKESSQCLSIETSVSFKHVTPSGVAVASSLSESEMQAYLVDRNLTGLASSYARARGSDRLASFGDFIALSNVVDTATANTIKVEVSDGVIAPGYSKDALAILSSKKAGNYLVLRINPDYEPEEIESRDVFGITIKQKRNGISINNDHLANIVTENRTLTSQVLSDIKLGMITLKYTQSNSIAIVSNGQVIGIGSGQQSRILCSNLALSKANTWCQKTNLDYTFLKRYEELKNAELDQIIEEKRSQEFGEENVLKYVAGTCLVSDGFFPQSDCIELAYEYGIKFIAAPMGSIRDSEIISTANMHGITFINTGVRLFHH